MIALNQINLILWDLDGTLIDSEHIHYQAGMNAFNQLGVTTTNNRILSGMDNYKCFETITGLNLNNQKHLALFHEWESIVTQEVLSLINDTVAIPQSIELMKYFHTQNIIQAIVSNSTKVVIEKSVTALNISSYLSNTFAIEDVVNPKPHPEPYLNAINYFNKSPQQTIVFEDSITGVTSAKLAEVKHVIGIGMETLSHNPHLALSREDISWIHNFNKIK